MRAPTVVFTPTFGRENGDNIVQTGDNASEIFMESHDCAEDEVIECSDSAALHQR